MNTNTEMKNPVASEGANGIGLTVAKTDWSSEDNTTKFDLSCLHISFKNYTNFCCWGQRDNPRFNQLSRTVSGEIKLNKTPCTPYVTRTGEIIGFIPTKANDPNTWTTFEIAYKAHQMGLVNGVGFQFGGQYDNEAFFGIDIDNYKGCSKEAVDEIINRFKGCYIESTPNGGHHIIGKGQLLKTGTAKKTSIPDKKGQFWLEGYGGESNRYFTMSGYVLAGHEEGSPEFTPSPENLTWLHEKYFKEEEEKPKNVVLNTAIKQTFEKKGYSFSRETDNSYQHLVDQFNQAVGIDAVLTRNGYVEAKKGTQTRYMGPTSQSGNPGVVLLNDRVFSHSTSDPLGDGHSHDAFDCFKILECGGDFRTAISHVRQMFETTPAQSNQGLEGETTPNVISMNAWRIKAFGKMLFAYENGNIQDVPLHPAIKYLRPIVKGNLRSYNDEVIFPLFHAEYESGTKPCGFISISHEFEVKYRYLPRTDTKTWRSGSYVVIKENKDIDTIVVCCSLESGIALAQETPMTVLACVDATNIPFVFNSLIEQGKQIIPAVDQKGSEIAAAIALGVDFSLPLYDAATMSDLRDFGSGLIQDSLETVVQPSVVFTTRPVKHSEFNKHVLEKLRSGMTVAELIAEMKLDGSAEDFNVIEWETLIHRHAQKLNAQKTEFKVVYDENRYITMPEGNTIALIAPMGTGKTTAIKQALKSGTTKTIVSHRIVLAKAIAETYGVPFYQERMNSFTGVSIVINSLNNGNVNKMTGGILVIDEIRQVLDQMANGFIVQDEPVYNALVKRIKSAEKVFCADAYMDEHTLEFIRKLRPDLKVLRSTFKTKEGVPARIYDDSKIWTRRLLATIKSGQKTAIASNSKEEVKTLLCLIKKHFPEKVVAAFTAESDSDEVLAFSANPNEYIQGLDVLIYSPVISSGVSIDVQYFDAVFVYAAGCVTISSEVLQQPGRIRAPTPLFVFVSSKKHRKLMSYDQIVNKVLSQSKKSSAFEKRALKARKIITKEGVRIRAELELTEFEQFCVERIHAREEDLRNLSENVQSHLANMGYTLIPIKTIEEDDAVAPNDGLSDDTKALSQEITEIKGIIKDAEDLDVFQARVLTQQEAEMLASVQQKTYADVCALKRYFIGRFYGKDEVTLELIQFHRENFKRASKLKLILFPQRNLERDFFEHHVGNKRNNRVHHKHRTLEGNFLRKALEVAGIECVGNKKSGLELRIKPNPLFYRGSQRLNKFTHWMNKKGNEAYLTFLPQIAFKNNNTPERAVLQVLKGIGLEFEIAKTRVGKTTASVYTLKRDSVAKLNRWGEDFRRAQKKNDNELVMEEDITRAA